jgi:hypothetical protein
LSMKQVFVPWISLCLSGEQARLRASERICNDSGAVLILPPSMVYNPSFS